MKKLFLLSIVLSMMMSCTTKKTETNPFFGEFTAKFGIPPFDQIKNSDYMPAFLKGMEEQNAEIEAIVKNQAKPDFANTIQALDQSGGLLHKVNGVFFNLTSAETNDSLKQISKDVSPLLSEHNDKIVLNAQLFEKIKQVYNNRASENLTREQTMLLEKYYKDFVRAGALLTPEQKTKLMAVNKDLSMLYIKFGDNVLAETNAFKLVIDNEADLKGLSADVIAGAADEANNAGMKGKWVFTLQKPSMIPFLQYAANRDLREKIYKAYINRGDNDNKNDNKATIDSIVNLRLEKANLLGFKSFADFALDDRMAKKPENVIALLNRIWEPALPKAKEEAAELKAMMNKDGIQGELKAWDWWYYTEKLRKEKFDLEESEIKPYFKLENVREGAFMVANKLWGITFTEVKDVPVYHKDVKVFEVKDKDGSYLGVYFVDYFPRAGKRAGAWMNNYRDQYVMNGKEVRPIIANVCNFTKPAGDTPSLLNLDEVETLFHEFGHFLHGMLTKCNYVGTSGTNVARDFVELPSQIMEHWSTHPEVLKMYAKHYKTGEIMPDNLINKISQSAKFNQGFITTELVAAALLDMNWHMIVKHQKNDVRAFESGIAKQINLIDEIAFRYRSTYFTHIFSDDGYAAGYYSYLWAEVLDADAFDLFAEKGIFNQDVAASYRKNILEKGGSEEPMTLYKQFRGAEPNPDALLRNRGLK